MGLGWRLERQLHAMERFCLGERLRRLFRLRLVIQVVDGGTALISAHRAVQPCMSFLGNRVHLIRLVCRAAFLRIHRAACTVAALCLAPSERRERTTVPQGLGAR